MIYGLSANGLFERAGYRTRVVFGHEEKRPALGLARLRRLSTRCVSVVRRKSVAPWTAVAKAARLSDEVASRAQHRETVIHFPRK